MFNATDSVEAGSILKPSLIPDRQISVPVCQSVNTSYFLATFRRKNAVSEAALVRCGGNGIVFAIQFRPAQIDQA